MNNKLSASIIVTAWVLSFVVAIYSDNPLIFIGATAITMIALLIIHLEDYKNCFWKDYEDRI